MDKRPFMHLLLGIVVCCVFGPQKISSNIEDGFVIYPINNPIKPVEGNPVNNVARFQYRITPWPPPCAMCKPNNTDYEKYEQVDLSFGKHKDGKFVELCQVHYEQGIYDEDTGNCTMIEPRMPAFNPAIPDGVVFELTDVNYTTDQGRYSLQVQYGNPTIDTPITLDIQVGPSYIEMTKEPNKTYEIGEMVRFECRVKNTNPGVDIRWTRGMYTPVYPDEGDYHKSDDYDDYSWSRIDLKVSVGDHGQAYMCWVGNGLGSEISASSSVSVIYAPIVELGPCIHPDIVYHVTQGNNARLTCHVNANPAAEQIKWYMSEDKSDMAVELPEYEGNTAVTIRRVNATDTHTHYWCQAISETREGRGRCQISVQYGAVIDIPAVKSVKEGASFSVQCEADARPAVTEYGWRKAGDYTLISHNHTIRFVDIKAEQAGGYECLATNILTPGAGTGNELPHTATKVMDVKVEFKARAHEYTVWKFGGHENEGVTLRCDLWAYPDLSFVWRFDNKIIESNSERTITDDGQLSTLTIHVLKDSDYGEYDCTASNTEGGNVFKMQLLRPGRPDEPQACEAVEVSDNEVTIKCYMGYDGGETLAYYAERQDGKKRRKVELTYNVPNMTTSMATMPRSPLQATVRLEQLPPDTNHTLYIYQENKHGRSRQNLQIYVKTLAGSPVDPPRGGNVGAIIGAAFGAIVGLFLLVALAIYVFWKFGDEVGCAPYKKAPSEPYTIISSGRPSETDISDNEEGHVNKAYQELDSTQRGTQAENEYVKMPGMTKQQASGQVQMRQHTPGRETNDNRRSRPQSEIDAYRLREGQSNLAGMGALSHYSRQNLANSALEAKGEIKFEGARPKEQRVVYSNDTWEVPRNKLQIQQKLGEGAFGEVWRANAFDIGGKKGSSLVAVKFLRANTPIEEHRALVGELEVMKQLKPHPNVISLVGCCSLEEPLYIIMEHASKGNLQEFLRQNRAPQKNPYASGQRSQTLTARDLIVFSLQVASGMEYVSSKQFLHRDLAARNILVDNRLTCKIADFGLARDIINTRQYESKTQRRLPIRWMAPECLFDSVYSTKSDVWAFGILLWEIVTLGSTPYPGMSGGDIMELIKMDYRMDKPKHCSPDMYSIMRDCWNGAAQQRPTFPVLRKRLENLLWQIQRDPSRDIQVDQMKENMFDILMNQPGEKC